MHYKNHYFLTSDILYMETALVMVMCESGLCVYFIKSK